MRKDVATAVVDGLSRNVLLEMALSFDESRMEGMTLEQLFQRLLRFAELHQFGIEALKVAFARRSNKATPDTVLAAAERYHKMIDPNGTMAVSQMEMTEEM